ncbi:16S rRNA (uracil(1498)-N(3))-methyltransferase [Marinicella sp. W31]|uniref:16S rRNA (uracil(1498)-N(3))-methyltransferase n=1 Tax=Marinicella sp. W31 TaxID=3023713 RepID=UPI003758468A
MRISRIYLPITDQQFAAEYTIHDEKAHYIRNVLRLKNGDQLRIFTQDRNEYLCQIDQVDRHQVHIRSIETLPAMAPSKLHTTIIQGISSSDRMDYTVQKSAEMGAARIQPVWTEYCSTKIATNKYAKKQQHWQNIAISASEQCGRADILEIMPICTLSEAISDIGHGVYLEPTAESVLADLNNHQSLSVLIGPEGGFSQAEIQLFEKQQLTGIRMGQRVMRSETVAPVILAALHTLHGDFT